MDISFSCAKCGQSLVVDETGAGIAIDCPRCGKPVYVPSTEQREKTGAPVRVASGAARPRPVVTRPIEAQSENLSVAEGENLTKAEHPAIRASCHCLVVAVGIILVVLGVSYQNFFLVYPGLVVSLPFQIGALLCAIYGMCIGRVKQGLALLAGLSVLCILFYLGFMLVLQHHVDTTLSGIQQQMQEMQKQMMPQLPPLFKLPSR